MTLPRTDRLVLILQSSFSLYPSAFVSLTLSLPARSTRWKREVLTTFLPSLCTTVVLMYAVKMAWDLDDSKFMFVQATCLLSIPILINSETSFEFTACISVQFSRNDKPLSSLILILVCPAESNRSKIVSL